MRESVFPREAKVLVQFSGRSRDTSSHRLFLTGCSSAEPVSASPDRRIIAKKNIPVNRVEYLSANIYSSHKETEMQLNKILKNSISFEVSGTQTNRTYSLRTRGGWATGGMYPRNYGGLKVTKRKPVADFHEIAAKQTPNRPTCSASEESYCSDKSSPAVLRWQKNSDDHEPVQNYAKQWKAYWIYLT